MPLVASFDISALSSIGFIVFVLQVTATSQKSVKVRWLDRTRTDGCYTSLMMARLIDVKA
jgi:hypothetical protein